MDIKSLEANLAAWSNEFKNVSGEDFSVPPRLWKFMASRISETVGEVTGDDSITVPISGEMRKVEITGIRGRHLLYKYSDGSVGHGMLPIDSVPKTQRGKLTMILNELKSQGKI